MKEKVGVLLNAAQSLSRRLSSGLWDPRIAHFPAVTNSCPCCNMRVWSSWFLLSRQIFEVSGFRLMNNMRAKLCFLCFLWFSLWFSTCGGQVSTGIRHIVQWLCQLCHGTLTTGGDIKVSLLSLIMLTTPHPLTSSTHPPRKCVCFITVDWKVTAFSYWLISSLFSAASIISAFSALWKRTHLLAIIESNGPMHLQNVTSVMCS